MDGGERREERGEEGRGRDGEVMGGEGSGGERNCEERNGEGLTEGARSPRSRARAGSTRSACKGNDVI